MHKGEKITTKVLIQMILCNQEVETVKTGLCKIKNVTEQIGENFDRIDSLLNKFKL